MRCLVTGASGLLGTYLVEFLRHKKEQVVGWDLPAHDITDFDKTINGIHQVGPDVIFNLAAWTDVDGCEADVGKTTSVNFQGAWSVALGAAELGCKMVQMSTDYVFDGKAGRAYREDDLPNPLSVYGRSKHMSENAVAKACKKVFMVRTSWLFGRYGRNFVDTIRNKAREVTRLQVVNDQTGSPTYARDLCRPLWELAASDRFGKYHLTNSGYCTWYDLAVEIVRLIGASCAVEPTTTALVNRPAPRPAFSVLNNRNFRRKFGKELRPWQDALRSYLAGGDGVRKTDAE
jgi:dTDP-4-dehydrorhamnose reductase